MAMNRDKFRNIVTGLTTKPEDEAMPVAKQAAAEEPAPVPVAAATPGQGSEAPTKPVKPVETPTKRFAKTGRPKGRKTDPSGKNKKIKVSLYIDEILVNEIYEWAYIDRMQPGEYVEQVLRNHRDKEAKRRNSETA